jgi:hypothetical protein
VFSENGRRYVQFYDTVDNTVGPHVQSNYANGWYDEFFYWTPDMPEIMIKSAHVIKDAKDQDVKTLLYPTWSDKVFSNGKSPSIVFSWRDRWFLESDLPQAQRFYENVQAYFGTVGSYWHNDPDDISKGLKAHVSKKYWIDR